MPNNNPFDYGTRDIEGGPAYLDEPYIGESRLSGLEVEDRPGRQEGEIYDSISVTFEILGENKSGMRFGATEYAPDPVVPSVTEMQENPEKPLEVAGYPTTAEEALSRVASAYKRIAHLLHPYFGTDEAHELTQRHQPLEKRPREAWDDLRAEIAEKWEQLSDDVKNKVVNIKVIADFNGTKPRLKLPRYAGFITENTPLTFSQDERADIHRWIQFQNAEPTDMGGTATNGNGVATQKRASF